MIYQKESILRKKRGFTLLELLIVMAIAGIIMTVIWTAFRSQHRSYLAQDETTMMQQNIRAAVDILVREIRMAGYDPNGLGAGVTAATPTSFSFSMDNNAGGLDTITYSLNNPFGGAQGLGRAVNGGAPQPVAENIDAIDFVYLNGNGNPTATLANIRSVQVSMVARAGQPDTDYVHNLTYANQQGTNFFSVDTDGDDNDNDGVTDEAGEADNFRRRLLSMTVKCRNLGI